MNEIEHPQGQDPEVGEEEEVVSEVEETEEYDVEAASRAESAQEQEELDELAEPLEGEEAPPEFEPQPHGEADDDLTPDAEQPIGARGPDDLRGDLADEHSYSPEDVVNSD